MKYNIIANEQQLNNFINWLPDTLSDEYYYCYLLARKKYDIHNIIKTNKQTVLKRFICNKKM